MNDCLKPVSGHVNSIETRFPSTARHFELQLGQFFGFELHLSLVDQIPRFSNFYLSQKIDQSCSLAAARRHHHPRQLHRLLHLDLQVQGLSFSEREMSKK